MYLKGSSSLGGSFFITQYCSRSIGHPDRKWPFVVSRRKKAFCPPDRGPARQRAARGFLTNDRKTNYDSTCHVGYKMRYAALYHLRGVGNFSRKISQPGMIASFFSCRRRFRGNCHCLSNIILCNHLTNLALGLEKLQKKCNIISRDFHKKLY